MKRSSITAFALVFAVACQGDVLDSPDPQGPLFRVNDPPEQSLVGEDTYISNSDKNTNFGADTQLRFTVNGKDRILIRFTYNALDDAQIAAHGGQVFLALTIADNYPDWEAGVPVALHRMTHDWTWDHATWNCAHDLEPGNNALDCDPGDEWDQNPNSPNNPWMAVPTGTVLFTNDLTGTVTFDVTADVAWFLNNGDANYGWVLLRTDDATSGSATFYAMPDPLGPRLLTGPCEAGEICGQTLVPIDEGTNPAPFDVQTADEGAIIARLDVDENTVQFEGGVTPPSEVFFALKRVQVAGSDVRCLGLEDETLEVGPCWRAIAVDLDGNEYGITFSEDAVIQACIGGPSVSILSDAADFYRMVRRENFDVAAWPDPQPSYLDDEPLKVLMPVDDVAVLDCSAFQFGASHLDSSPLLRLAGTIWRKVKETVSPQPLYASLSPAKFFGHHRRTSSGTGTLSFFSWAKLQLPYRDAGYVYQTVGKQTGKSPCIECDLGRVPKDWYLPGFDDSSWWQDGLAAFGNTDGYTPSCDPDLYPTIVADWPHSDPKFNPPQITHVLLRKTFYVLEEGDDPAGHTTGAMLQVRLALRNDVRVYLNGEEVTQFVTEPVDYKLKNNGFVARAGGCPGYDEVIFTIPWDYVNPDSYNLLAVHARSTEPEPSFVDVQVNVIEP
jgi:hypothetical protein